MKRCSIEKLFICQFSRVYIQQLYIILNISKYIVIFRFVKRELYIRCFISMKRIAGLIKWFAFILSKDIRTAMA